MVVAQRTQHRDNDEAEGVRVTAKIAEKGTRGGWLSAAFSAVAVVLSCFSFYMSTLQGAKLETYVPPSIHYGRDADSEVFAIPVTIANSGARSAAVLSLELEVQNLKTNASKRYYSAFLGEHPREPVASNRQFAPLSIPGRGIFTETVRFYPVGDALPRVVDAEGEYAFRLVLNTAAPPDPSLFDRLQGRVQPAPIDYRMTLPWMSDQQLSMRRGTIAMYAKGFRPVSKAQ
jgi:hypothetical protein